MQVLVTHINPHLDDIAAIWLYRKFHPEYSKTPVEFVSASRKQEEDKNKIFFGTGGGKFDEHKGNIGDSAMSLVWKDIQGAGLTPKSKVKLGAFKELVLWNTRIDTGKAPAYEFSPFGIQAYIRPLDSTQEGSSRAVVLGSEILDRILEGLIRKHHGIKDWRSKVGFESVFGRSFAVSSNAIDRAFCKQKKGDLFLIYKPKDRSVQFFTPSHTIDLEPLYKELTKHDPKASWYLHQSHHIILCGSGSSPSFAPTSVRFEDLIGIAKNVNL